MSGVSDRDLIDFVYAEARLLDLQRYDEWVALFAEEGHYWVPLQGARQADPHSHNSLAYEDRLLLSLRVERLKDPRAHSQHPPSHAQHVLQQPFVEHRDDEAGRYELRTPFIYVEARAEQQLLLGGAYRHTLQQVGGAGGALRILLKRVDLLNPEAAFPAIQLFP
jgi:3-phenylpropionate/cinnamic acid dioxygenase small subunit